MMLEYIKQVLDLNGRFGIADIKHGTWIVFPIQKFHNKEKGKTEITIIIDENDLERTSNLNEWLDQKRKEYVENQAKEKVD